MAKAYLMKGGNVTVCPFAVQESYLRHTYIHCCVISRRTKCPAGGPSIFVGRYIYIGTSEQEGIQTVIAVNPQAITSM